MSTCAMELVPLLGISRTPERPSFLLIGGRLLLIPVISSVDLPIFLLLLLHGPLLLCVKESGLGLRGLDALICYCQPIDHIFWLLHGDLPNSLDVCDPIAEGINDFNIVDVWDSIPDITEMFHIILEDFIMLLLDGLKNFGGQ
jgi:hypothetical protein